MFAADQYMQRVPLTVSCSLLRRCYCFHLSLALVVVFTQRFTSMVYNDVVLDVI